MEIRSNRPYDVKDFSNVIIQRFEKKGGITVTELMDIVVNFYHDCEKKGEIPIINEKPTLGVSSFYMKSIFHRFRYYDFTEYTIKQVPSDFNFMLLLEDNHEKRIQEEYVGRLSKKLIERMNEIERQEGEYISEILKLLGYQKGR